MARRVLDRMQANTADQIAGLALLDVEAKKQSRMFLWIGLALLPLAVGFPVAAAFTGIPYWVAGIMFVCAGFLAGVCILLAFTRGSPTLAHLRIHPDDPLVEAYFWTEVRRGVRNLQLECRTEHGAALHEVLFVAGPDEERVIASLQRVVPVVRAAG